PCGHVRASCGVLGVMATATATHISSIRPRGVETAAPRRGTIEREVREYGDVPGLLGGSGVLLIQACALFPGLLPILLLAAVFALPLLIPVVVLGVLVGIPVGLWRLVRRLLSPA